MDFSNAQLQQLTPLKSSFAVNDIEADLKQLFIDLFIAKLGADNFDANVLGVPHLGSFGLVQKSINRDGLVVLRGNQAPQNPNEEAATRYLYRAWKSGDVKKRGLHFLRTYLQLLYPNVCQVNQLWQSIDAAYPTSLATITKRQNYWLYAIGESGLKLDGTWKIGGSRPIAQWETERNRVQKSTGMFLTSRIEIALDFSVQLRDISILLKIFQSVIPAKLVIQFKAGKVVLFFIRSLLDAQFLLQKSTSFNTGAWNILSNNPIDTWTLNGAKKIVEKRISAINTTARSASALLSRHETIPADFPDEYYIPPQPIKLGVFVRKLDGSWKLGNRKMTYSARIGSFKILNNAPPVLLPKRMSRLSLNGRWKLGGNRNAGFEFSQFLNGVRQIV